MGATVGTVALSTPQGTCWTAQLNRAATRRVAGPWPTGPCLLAALVLLCGCAGVPVEPEGADFEVDGKVGVIEGERSFSARFSWRQNGSRYAIDVWGPLGQGTTRLRGDSHRLQVIDGDGAPLVTGHPQTVMRQQLGWSLPLPVMRWWLSGRPAPLGAVSGRETDARGRLTAFSQHGWQVAYPRFELIDGVALPRRMVAQRPGYRVRIVILSR